MQDVPEGCSTPDFEKKPLTLTLQEGETVDKQAKPQIWSFDSMSHLHEKITLIKSSEFLN